MNRAPPSRTRHIALVEGHPDPRRIHFCHALADAYVSGARAAALEVERIEVAKLDFPLLRSREDQERSPVPEGIRTAQATLLRADHVVMTFPVWNGAAPALLKGFLEQVFRPSFVFPDARSVDKLGFTSYFTQRKALAGKTARIVATMAMPAFVYRLYFRPHLEKNSLLVSGLGPVRESLVGMVESSNGGRRERWLDKMARLGREGR